MIKSYSSLNRINKFFLSLHRSHLHLTQITTFEDSDDGLSYPPQLIVGNSGTQMTAPVIPLDEFGGKVDMDSLDLPIVKVKGKISISYILF